MQRNIMPCYYPLVAWRPVEILTANPDSHGRRQMTFDPQKGIPGTKTLLPCGQCIGCRLDRSRKWAIRCMHEARYHDRSCFVTLTISDDYPQYTYTLDKDMYVKFMKRLRKAIDPIHIRFFHCGEYGKQLSRPHHHMCLFGYDFPDKVLHKMSGTNHLYISPQLHKLWPYGYCYIGALTYDSAMYVAKYILKKRTGKQSKTYDDRIPEYITMSRRPGIGRKFYDEFRSDIYNYDKLIVRHNFVLKPPRYYDNIYMTQCIKEFESIKRSRRTIALKHMEVSRERLDAIANVQRLRQERMLRRFDES